MTQRNQYNQFEVKEQMFVLYGEEANVSFPLGKSICKDFCLLEI